MKKNMGSVDKAIRILIAIVIGILYFTGQISGTLAIILGIFAIIFILTSLVSFCPLYTICGFSSCKMKEENQE